MLVSIVARVVNDHRWPRVRYLNSQLLAPFDRGLPAALPLSGTGQVALALQLIRHGLGLIADSVYYGP